MDRILFVNVCVRPQSRTRRLAEAVLEQLPGRVEEVRLAEARVEQLDNAGLEARMELVRTGKLDAPALPHKGEGACV